ncbi:Chemotaxis phosphatase CheX [Malonomonas rubra DSM 5091]|uniref:Chemotaxis phosphatase CheX n=1 Tax=Malonomonas rubra DSM 5091 TaxID=1122189 RepID=A0A1M6IM83_MALRU|nr:chemotaxis protein CheX [Malonomonas rubra]SHJ35592.1 Chemotaxis phosphatase CheX [Malonomonas rubra DSM 5091]
MVETLIPATEDLFSSFVSLSASAGTPFQRADVPEADGLAGIVHFSGQTSGYVALCLPAETAALTTKLFLFLEAEHVENEQIDDAVGELTNILAGQVKSLVDPQGSNVNLSLPMICSKQDFTAVDLPGTERVTIPFYTDDGDFFVEVQLASKLQ